MKKYKNLLTIIIPRHIDRVSSIKDQLLKMNLTVHLDEPKKKISPNTDVYLVNSYGKTKSFYKVCKNVFLGGSLIKHGGQNPLEPARHGCNVLYGPHVDNFKSIYNYLDKIKVSKKIQGDKSLYKNIETLIRNNRKTRSVVKKVKNLGDKILIMTIKYAQK